ncbi:5,10-methylenetetrahydrofolate reductase [Cephaloticoccus capnophilus]|uniref:Methylenetetrahydrofolate reductase n=1 Tax=Cephaloticoccus capnophilus TaxID=1548208 RepID=A0A139STL8_9BACT|nr:methylenetetrahydrofolate reductase [NAD(P)H] [Cephaloticoccus capnophilus]KXU37822.1 5,10-methylenetetrahydrofolate reductase [Cephaloticoccus capnophilus]
MISDSTISRLFSEKSRPLRSLEFFPPKEELDVLALKKTASELVKIAADFASVTYGAGGGTRQRTAEVSQLLRGELGCPIMPHLTCVGHSREELHALADEIHASGFRNIMTLRGDLPKSAVQSGTGQKPLEDDAPRYASDLVALLKARHSDFCLGVAAYPEKHPQAASLESDIAHLKAKIDAGADFAVTQLFFDNAVYFRFVEKCRAAGISVPIVPGIMPALSLAQVRRFTAMCEVVLPEKLAAQLAAAGEDNPDEVAHIGTQWTIAQVRELLASGAPGYHLYTLNRARSAVELCAALAEA